MCQLELFKRLNAAARAPEATLTETDFVPLSLPGNLPPFAGVSVMRSLQWDAYLEDMNREGIEELVGYDHCEGIGCLDQLR